MENKKYYWLKLKRDFFKRHDIQIIESMPNGKDYILFYLKLLCESVDHEGNLRFSQEIPYNEEMLSVITNTNIDVVRSAIKVFTKLNMMELLDDGTYYMNEVNKMIGSETEWAEKKRIYREQKAQLGQCPQPVLSMSDKSIDIDIEKDKEIDKDIDIDLDKKKNKKENTKQKFGENGKIILTLDQYQKLCNDYGIEYVNAMIDKLDEYVAMNNNKNGYKDFNLVMRKAIKEEWFKLKKSDFNKPVRSNFNENEEDSEHITVRAKKHFEGLYNTDVDRYYRELEELKKENPKLAKYVITQVENGGFEEA